MKPALEGNNYCSNLGHRIGDSKTNAFYLKSNNLNSGEHKSRLTVRTTFDAYQYYQVGGTDHQLNADNYLIVNEGQMYFNEIESEVPAEALIVAFKPGEVEMVHQAVSKNAEYQLENPYEITGEPIIFSENAYFKDQCISLLFHDLKTMIVSGNDQKLKFEETCLELLERMLHNHSSHLKKLDKIDAVKTSTKEELLRRVGRAKDFMDAHFKENITITDLARIATLSNFHFLRTFSKIFRKTPHQYLRHQRLKYAAHLLEKSSLPVSVISSECGFENHSAFGRSFKKVFGQSPSTFRK
ncbi:MAG: AraC family transcriptional regulator [Bacteroidota bacterium]